MNKIHNMKTVGSFKELANKYGFTTVEGETVDGKEYVVILQANNTDNTSTDWVKYHATTNTVQLVGNTDNLNIWLCDTRKDLTPKKIIDFVTELNNVFDLGDDGFSVKELIDPEDWQEIANINDAYEDSRYF